MNKKKIILSLILMVCLLSISGIAVQAKTDVIYIVDTMMDVNPVYLSAISESGLNYTIVTDDDIAGVNFSDYNMIFVNNNDFSDPRSIPINDYPALIMNRNGLSIWGWSYIVSRAVLPSPYKIVNQRPTHPIMQGINMTDIPVYTSQI